MCISGVCQVEAFAAQEEPTLVQVSARAQGVVGQRTCGMGNIVLPGAIAAIVFFFAFKDDEDTFKGGEAPTSAPTSEAHHSSL